MALTQDGLTEKSLDSVVTGAQKQGVSPFSVFKTNQKKIYDTLFNPFTPMIDQLQFSLSVSH